jgi:hypothetical protein
MSGNRPVRLGAAGEEPPEMRARDRGRHSPAGNEQGRPGPDGALKIISNTDASYRSAHPGKADGPVRLGYSVAARAQGFLAVARGR